LYDSNDWIGPPHDYYWSISDVQVDATSSQCLGDWVCEHRWPLIKAMVKFRSVAGDSALTNWWDDGGRLIAFSRAGKAFIAINDDPAKTMDVVRQTGLSTGVYCDVTSGTLTTDCKRCTGRSVSGMLTNTIIYNNNNNIQGGPKMAPFFVCLKFIKY